mmetsp:Transcript_15264/g.30608  ORF Transcript_15264/g.30608 Transcript_15264/m.30608 type:complete len:292 (-) Transcript_15264:91-966(-)
MGAVYFDDANVSMVRVGNQVFVPTFNGFLFSETKNMGTEANLGHICPAMCETSSVYCSAPGFQIEYRHPTTGYMADLYELYGFPQLESQFGFDAYTEEAYVLNDAKMDPGHIACKTTQPGSRGKLGFLQPITSSDFFVSIESTKPFKLAESYYFCYPDKIMTFVESFGIAQGNASIVFTFLLMSVILSLSAGKLLHLTVTQNEMENTMMQLAEVIKIKRMGGKLLEEHDEILGIFHSALALPVARSTLVLPDARSNAHDVGFTPVEDVLPNFKISSSHSLGMQFEGKSSEV